MAFIRVEKKASGTYIRLLESYREGKSVKHRTLYTLGKAEDFAPKELEAIGRKLIALSGAPADSAPGALAQELGRYNYGYPLVVTSLLRKIGMDVVLARFGRAHKLSYSLFDCLALLLCNRLEAPSSKRGAFLEQSDYVGLGEVKLQHVYRSLDYFSRHQEWLQEYLFKQRGKMGGAKLDLVFYDVTTFYFHSEQEKEGALRQMGYGKDGKIGKTQVVFGLLVDVKGCPVGYRVYSGDTYEGHTFADAVKVLRKTYNIRRVVVVADSGMMNRDNVGLFQKGNTADGFEYIVADRLKSLKELAQNYLCDLKNYDTTTVRDLDGTMIPLRYAVLEYEGRALLATYSEKRAKKDAHERQKKIEKGRKLLDKPGLVNKKAKRFYLKNVREGADSFELDLKKIEKDARFDGFSVLATNALDLTPPQILQKYKDLYHVEHSFRTFKSFLETRPMFHWTDERIKGHLFVCYISYYLLAHLKHTLNEACIGSTELKIQQMLSKMELSKVKNDPNIFFLRSKMDEPTQKTLEKLKLPILSDIIPERELAGLLR